MMCASELFHRLLCKISAVMQKSLYNNLFSSRNLAPLLHLSVVSAIWTPAKYNHLHNFPIFPSYNEYPLYLRLSVIIINYRDSECRRHVDRELQRELRNL
jgi:hypothetical protein